MITASKEQSAKRLVEVEPTTGRRPRTVERLRDWEYLERQSHRMLCAWGRYFHEWADIIAAHRHVWEAAECVRRLRDRLVQFPGGEWNHNQSVSSRLEHLANTVLDAPTHEDAIDGIYGTFSKALTLSYANYAAAAHPVHDAPTLALINEVMTIREGMRLWMRDYRRRRPHRTDPRYDAALRDALANCGGLLSPITIANEEPAQAVGIATDFRLPLWSAKPAGAEPNEDFMRYVEADFVTHVEARRLFWCHGYMREINLAMDQLRWIWDTPYMPWDFHHDLSRHLWDESRHGDSGYSRLLDFGISLPDIGMGSYADDERWSAEERPPLRPHAAAETTGAFAASGSAEPRTPAQMYESVFHIGMIAETAHFQVKREAYDDFKAGGDLESAEMMLFDIIDEQTHVKYAHRWLPELTKHAGVEHEGYRDRAAGIRKQMAQRRQRSVREAARHTRAKDDPAYAKYQRLLERMRLVLPLSNAADPKPRTNLPM